MLVIKADDVETAVTGVILVDRCLLVDKADKAHSFPFKLTDIATDTSHITHCHRHWHNQWTYQGPSCLSEYSDPIAMFVHTYGVYIMDPILLTISGLFLSLISKYTCRGV